MDWTWFHQLGQLEFWEGLLTGFEDLGPLVPILLAAVESFFPPLPLVAIVGDIGDDVQGAYDAGVSAIFSINRLAVPRDEAKARSHIDYTHTLDDLLRCIRAAEQFKR